MPVENEIARAIKTAEITNYLNKDYQYLKNVNIVEWDIHSAGLSVLKFRKLLPEDELKELEGMEKHARTVREGWLQKEKPEVAKEIISTLSKVRQAFVIANHIYDREILTIKKDAIFLINKTPTMTIIKDVFEFRKKGTYSSYMLLNDNKEFYYNSFLDSLEIKGLTEEAKKKQSEFILKDIKKIIKSGEKLQPDMMYVLLKNYRDKYLNRKLPVETYRELDSGKFRIGNYMLEDVSEDLLSDIDISQNYMNYILPMINILI